MFETVRFQNILPPSTNLKIIKLLTLQQWNYAFDNYGNENVLMENIFNNVNHGFFYRSYQEKKGILPVTEDSLQLNTYAEVVTDIVNKKLNFTNYNIHRIAWNMYFPNAQTSDHIDCEDTNYFTILYNLHTTDGGIEINKKFNKDEMGTATVFQSNIKHRGVPPVKDHVRFNLNIIFKKLDSI